MSTFGAPFATKVKQENIKFDQVPRKSPRISASDNQ